MNFLRKTLPDVMAEELAENHVETIDVRIIGFNRTIPGHLVYDVDNRLAHIEDDFKAALLWGIPHCMGFLMRMIGDNHRTFELFAFRNNQCEANLCLTHLVNPPDAAPPGDDGSISTVSSIGSDLYTFVGQTCNLKPHFSSIPSSF